MTCSRCHSETPADAKFCPACGAALTAAPAPESYTPKHLAEKILRSRQGVVGERKQISVLFADLKGSMELLAQRDPEEANSILDPVLKHMMEAVHRYEGTVNQVMGDGIMALFGAPLAHEDHAVRACYAALRIQEAIGQYAADVQRRHGVHVRVRVGLNSGEVVVRSVGSDLRMDYTAVGQTTHLAARMEQIAEPGQILITAEGLLAAEGYVETKPLGPVQVKGLASPVEVYEITGAGPVRTRLQAALARGLTCFTGREPAMAQLCSAIERARAGHGQVVSIVGEPGVGKSRLVHEFVNGADTREWLALKTGPTPHGRATSYLPVIALLREYFKIDSRDDHAQIRRKVAEAVRALDPALESIVSALLALLDVPVADAEWDELNPQLRRRLTFDALRRLLLRQSEAQPLLLVFEDVHAIDSESEALLEGLVESMPALQVLVLATYRPEYRHKWASLGYHSQLRLEPLNAHGAAELLKALLGEQPTLAPVSAMLIERTGGNPFFLEEGVRALIETGVIARERDAYRLVKDLKSVQVPPTVQAVLAARIDRLSVDEKWLLQSAAVIGRTVPLSLLQAISEHDEDTLRGLLARLQAAEFLYETSLFPELEYAFKHALTQEVAYNALLHETRRALHGRIVEALERGPGSGLTDQIDRLAHHALKGELWEKAITYLTEEGLKATARSASAEAVACVEQALAALSHLPETPETIAQGIDLRFNLHSALIPLGEFSRIVRVLRDAEKLADRLGDRARQGRVSASMATWYWCIGDPDRALESGQRALAMAAALEDGALEAVANHRVGEAHVSLGNYRQAIASFERNLELRTSAPSPKRFGMAALQSVTSRSWMAWCLACVGEFGVANVVARESIRVAEAANHPYSLATTYSGAGQRHQMQGEFALAIPLLERALDLCRRGNFGPLYRYTAPNLGLAYVRSGRIEEGLELLECSSAQAASMHIVPFDALEATHLSEARLAAGRRAAALECAERGLAVLRTHRQRFAEPEMLRVLGDIYATRTASGDAPDFRAAEAAYLEAMSHAAECGLRPVFARCRLHLGTMYAAAGRRELALEQLGKARELLDELEMRFWREKADAAIACLQGKRLFNPSEPAFHANPYPFYHRLRAEDPVHQTEAGYWVVTRYADVVSVLRDPRFGREDFGPMVSAIYGEDSERVPRPMVFRDPPAHTRLRSLVSKAFTSRVVQGMRPHIQGIVDRLLDRVQHARSMDVIADLAYPLPVTVICEMLGVPEGDRDTMRRWSDDIARSLDALGLPSDREIVRRGRAARHALGEYFRGLLPERRRHPRADLLSLLLAAEEQGDKLTEDELLATCVLIFIAGHETTVNLIGNGLLALLQHPRQWMALKEDPELLPGAVEELLRYDSPVQRTARVTTAEVRIGDKSIPRHALVVAAIGAANRDPERFAEPDRLDIARRDKDHIAFGFGIHFCLGAPLARIEAQIALGTLLRRLPRLALATEAPQWRESSTLRGLKALPLTF
ncbi:MAG TPA: cytochrome P450 [Burkholderiales bacterium]|nr:cytochrome P450 [Burkholderiales bacterium]